MRSGFLGRGIGPNAFGGGAADWWAVAGQTCVAAYQPIGAASLAASYINLANPGTYDAAPGVAPTLVAAGWVFNGSTQYLTTGVVPSAGWSWAIRYSGYTSGTTSPMAAYILSPTSYFGLFLLGANVEYLAGGHLDVSPQQTAGILGIAGSYAYRNGVFDGEIPVGNGFPALPFFIGSANLGGVPDSYFSGSIAAIAIYSTTLSAADVAALTTRMAALA